MVRGGTHLHGFSIPFEFEEIKEIYITYVQKDRVVLSKKTEDCVYDDSKRCVQVRLTQKDTLSFAKPGFNPMAEDSLVLIQIRIILNNNNVCISYPIKERLYDVFDGGGV